MTSARARSMRNLVIEDSMSVDKCDCALNHPAHRGQKGGQNPPGPGTGMIWPMTKVCVADG